MDQRTESIRQEIDETRESMTEKFEHIEGTVRGAGDNVRQSMHESIDRTADNVKDSVGHTIDQVKTKLNLEQIVHERPWIVFGASVLAGYMIGNLNNSSSSDHDDDYDAYDRRRYYERRRRAERSYNDRAGQAYAEHHDEESMPLGQHLAIPDHPQTYDPADYSSSNRPAPQRGMQKSQGMLSDVMDQFSDEIEAMKDASVAAMTRMLRETLQENLPQLAEEYDRARRERMQEHQYAGPQPDNKSKDGNGHDTAHRPARPTGPEKNVEPTSQVDPAVVEGRH